MRCDKLPWKSGFTPTAQALKSFEGRPSFYRIHGPAEFCRLVHLDGERKAGAPLQRARSADHYWFHQSLMDELRVAARSDLKAARTSTTSPHKSLVALYLRFCLRGVLAVSKNWNENFDAYVKLALARGESLVALVGKVKGQPYYDETHPDHERVEKAGITLEGREWQYVIDFQFPANQPHWGRISAPHRLEGW